MIDLLILSVGGNPLPNYVVGKYFSLKHQNTQKFPRCTKILLIHSKETMEFAYSIKDLLSKELQNSTNSPITFLDILDNERDLDVIDRKLCGSLMEMLKTNPLSSIHLNYTGGTKSMILQTFITTSKFCEENKIQLFISDIDPEKFKIQIKKIEKNDTEIYYYPEQKDLRDFIIISLEDLLKLHLMRNMKSYDTTSRLFSIKLIEKLFTKPNDDKETDERLRIWNNLRNCFRNDKLVEDKVNKCEFRPVNSKELINIELLNNKFRDLGIDEYIEFIENISKEENKSSNLKIQHLKEVASFLSGDWLEDYVFYVIKNIKDLKYSELKKNIHTFYNNRETEIDLILINGYQFFLLSITSSIDIKIIKSKCFEALYRAEQLSGLYAKSIIISLASDNTLQKLNNDLSEFNAKKNAYLIGYTAIYDELTQRESNERISIKLNRIFNGDE